jgi:uroporphyrinogen decarboxylase
MTHRERAVAALECRVPDYVPTFELEYQLAPEMFGKDFLRDGDLAGLSQKEIDYKLEQNAEFMVEVYAALEHSILPISWLSEPYAVKTARHIQRLTGGKVLLTYHGDGTFEIPDGNKMYEFAYRTADDPEGLHEEAKYRMNTVIERNKRMFDAGVESFILCSDYCYNSGPFLSPTMFREFITPYLAGIIDAIRSMGGYAIKHTDGNIMPILDQLIECRPHAIHSIDPMAGVDIAKVKKITAASGVAICGNVNCALMQTGSDDEVRESALYALTHGKPGGGYIYCTSNVPFRGLPPERYQMILDIWKQYREY